MSSTSSFDGVGGGSFVNDPDRYISNQAGVVMSGPVLAAAVDAGVSDSVDELRRELDVSAALGRDEIRIHAEGATPEEAVARADAVATAYREFSKAAVQTQTDQLVQLSTTAAERAQVLKRAAVFGDGVAFAELAALPEAPSSPAPLRDGLFGLLVGLALGIGLAYLLEHRSVRRVNGPVPVADRAAAEAVATAPDGAAGPAPSIRHDLESAGSAR
jgi:capsular polysaccharide biosynthesis protein